MSFKNPKASELSNSIITVQVITDALSDRIENLSRMVKDTTVDLDSSYQTQLLMAELGFQLDGLKQYMREINKWTKRVDNTSNDMLKCNDRRLIPESRIINPDIFTQNWNARDTFERNRSSGDFLMGQFCKKTHQHENENQFVKIDSNVDLQNDSKAELFDTSKTAKNDYQINKYDHKVLQKKRGRNSKYSEEFKKTVVDRIEKGDSIRSLSDELKISYSTIKRWETEQTNIPTCEDKITELTTQKKFEEKIIKYASKELEESNEPIDWNILAKKLKILINSRANDEQSPIANGCSNNTSV